MTPSPDRELLSQSAARQLLERAGEIDSESTSVDTLRAAAREAGISDAAFDAALTEMRGKLATHQEPHRPPRNRGRAASLVAGALLLAATVFIIIPRLVGPSFESEQLPSHEFVVKCLPMERAQGIARTLLRDNEIVASPGSRVMRVRATSAQFAELQAALDAAARSATSCEPTAPGR